ncbi:MAG: DUF3237 domain-containing protein [Rubrivivax sp.]
MPIRDFPPAPALQPFAQVDCLVGPLTNLGPAPLGERRCVPLLGGQVSGPGLSGRILPGGVDWQILRQDGVLEIAAHYVVATDDGALVEVRSDGLRHGPPEVMARLSAGEAVPPAAYFFRTLVRLTTGAPAWLHLNRRMLVASGERLADRVRLNLYDLG